MSAQAAASEVADFPPAAARRSRRPGSASAATSNPRLCLRHGRRPLHRALLLRHRRRRGRAGGARGDRSPIAPSSTTASSPSSASASIRPTRRRAGSARPSPASASSGISTARSAGSTAPSPAEAAGPARPRSRRFWLRARSDLAGPRRVPVRRRRQRPGRWSWLPDGPAAGRALCRLRAAGAGPVSPERVRAGPLPAPDRPLRGSMAARNRASCARSTARPSLLHDHGHKRRRDYIDRGRGADPRDSRRRIMRRIVPRSRRSISSRPTRMERYIVSCYAAEDGGHFRAHRDNTTKGTAHRRFAVSINLNADFEGGEVSFPEYGPRELQARRPAAPWCSPARCCTRSRRSRAGRRFAFLPFLYDDEAARMREANNAHSGRRGRLPTGLSARRQPGAEPNYASRLRAAYGSGARGPTQSHSAISAPQVRLAGKLCTAGHTPAPDDPSRLMSGGALRIFPAPLRDPGTIAAADFLIELSRASVARSFSRRNPLVRPAA